MAPWAFQFSLAANQWLSGRILDLITVMAETVQQSLFLHNARLVLPEQVVEGGIIVIEQGRIASISELDAGGGC